MESMLQYLVSNHFAGFMNIAILVVTVLVAFTKGEKKPLTIMGMVFPLMAIFCYAASTRNYYSFDLWMANSIYCIISYLYFLVWKKQARE